MGQIELPFEPRHTNLSLSNSGRSPVFPSWFTRADETLRRFESTLPAAGLGFRVHLLSAFLEGCSALGRVTCAQRGDERRPAFRSHDTVCEQFVFKRSLE